MFRSRSVALSASALLLSAPMLLTGCGLGGSDSKSSSAAPSQSQSQTQSESKSDNGSSSPTESTSSASTSAQGGADGKPSKDEVKTGLVKYYTDQGVPQSGAETLAGCMVDKGYDKFSAKTLTAMKDGKPGEIDPTDSANFVAVTGQCAPSGAGLPSGLPTSLPTG